MKKLIKHIFKKHWNCLPWLLYGIFVISEGEVKIGEYVIVWICLLILIWYELPVDDNIDK